MKLLADPVASLKRHAEVRQAVQAGDAARALTAYLEGYESISGRAILEWQLASLLIRTGAATQEFPAWPQDLLERPSGATLAFVVSQIIGADLMLPEGFAQLRPIRKEHKEIVALAWLLRPDCACLKDAAFRSRFASWLAEAPAAIGNCLLAAALAGDQELVGWLGPTWTRRGIFHFEAPTQILQAGRVPGLQTFAREAARRAVALFFRDRPSLLRLLHAAFPLGEFASVMALGEALLGQGGLDEKEQQTITALQLGSLVELDRHDEVVDTYRARWLPA